jgi:hypothetical protein
MGQPSAALWHWPPKSAVGEIPVIAPETPIPGPRVLLRGVRQRVVADLFSDGFCGFNPCLAFEETHMRELGSFDHTRAVRFKYAPVVVKGYFTKPSVLHGANFLHSVFGNNPVNASIKHGVNGLKR